MRLGVLAVLLLLTAPLVLASAPPSVPLNLATATGSAPGSIDLTWDQPASEGGSPVAGFRVYRANTPTGLVHIFDLGNVTSFTDNTAAGARPKYYRISAVNADGEGPLTAPVVGFAQAVPTEPRNPVAYTGPGIGNISFFWTPPEFNGTHDVIGYTIYRSNESSGPFDFLGITASTGYLDSGLANNTTRYYRVSASNVLGESQVSATAVGRTPSAPSAVKNLTAALLPGFFIDLDWDEPDDLGGLLLQKYFVLRKVDDDPWKLLIVTGWWQTHWRDFDCPNLSVCTYKVKAQNQIGDGPFSFEARAGIPLLLPP